MGHYCEVCGRTRANEKFSGRGHKKHKCKDCSRKPIAIQQKMMEELDNDLAELDMLFGADTGISDEFDEFDEYDEFNDYLNDDLVENPLDIDLFDDEIPF